MKQFENVSVQKVSWVKSNKIKLEASCGVANLYYPETIDELKGLICSFYENKEEFDLIGHCSNTLFLPSYKTKHLVCTKHLSKYTEDDDFIYCECGVPVSILSKYAVEKGYKGFEGLCDLPGTIASGVYGNCGCFGCTVLELVESFTLLGNDGTEKTLRVADLKPSFRSTALKRGELKGVIIGVRLKKVLGQVDEIKRLAQQAHDKRKATQPTGANNLGSTFNGGQKATFKGYLFKVVLLCLSKLYHHKQQRVYLPKALALFGKSQYSPYLWNWGRWMFYDEKSYELFPKYYEFLKTLFKDIRLEIEIKK